jgi:uncharacterized protein (TIGR03067 family)
LGQTVSTIPLTDPEGDPLDESKMMIMMKPIRVLTLACILSSVALAACYATRVAVAEEPALEPALKAIQGTWKTSENDSLDAKWVIKGETLEATVNGTEYVGKLKLDDKAKPHSTMDITLTQGPEDAKGKIAKAVFKLDGEKLVIAVSHPGGDRPKDFEAAGDEVYLFELKKQKNA